VAVANVEVAGVIGLELGIEGAALGHQNDISW
jgi:hypothetical protein